MQEAIDDNNLSVALPPSHEGMPMTWEPVAIHRQGLFRLKGVTELVDVVQVIPVALEGRLPLFARSVQALKVNGMNCCHLYKVV